MFKNLSYLRYFWDYMRDDQAALWEKFFIVLGIAYIIVPMDLIPEFIFPLGLLDDSIILVQLVLFTTRTLKSHHQKISLEKAKQKKRAKQTPIEADYYEIEEDW